MHISVLYAHERFFPKPDSSAGILLTLTHMLLIVSLMRTHDVVLCWYVAAQVACLVARVWTFIPQKLRNSICVCGFLNSILRIHTLKFKRLFNKHTATAMNYFLFSFIFINYEA